MTQAEYLKRYLDIKQRVALACCRARRAEDSVRLIAVTKTHPVETIQQLIDIGVHDIGENRVQEIVRKAPYLRGEFTLHMIGHLQTNKVNKVIGFVQWIQSVDSQRLIEKLESAAQSSQKKINVLIEVNTSGEQTKTGCPIEKAEYLCELVAKSAWLQFRGLMTLGPLGADEATTRRAFASLRNIGEKCRGLAPVIELSMGMSSDFEWAIEEGATMIRIGTALIGNRISNVKLQP